MTRAAGLAPEPMSAMAAASERWRAMGTTAAIYVVGESQHQVATAVDLGVQRIAVLESLWSRFQPNSELMRVNRFRGAGPVPVTADTARLVSTMVMAWHLTDGTCDASVAQAVRATGYDIDFSLLVQATQQGRILPGQPTTVPGLAGVVVTVNAQGEPAVTLPQNVELDPGAIGKGLAADIVVEELRTLGVTGVMVNLGGDIVLWGSPATADRWTVEVEDSRLPRDSAPVTVWQVDASRGPVAVATSTTLRRRWGAGVHHVIDPRTGQPSASDVLQATVMAGSGARAEALATMALVMGSQGARLRLADRPQPHVLITTDVAHPKPDTAVCINARRL